MTDTSPYQKAAPALRALDYHVIPLEAREKRPLLLGWPEYCRTFPSQETHEEWLQYAGANIGVCLGYGILGLDYDYDHDGLHDKIQKIVPASPVIKKGAKGFTAFYRATDIRTQSFKVKGEAVCEILSIGRQTVLPPSIHPDGMEYKWLTPMTLETMSAAELPEFTQEHAKAIEALFISVKGKGETPAKSTIGDATNTGNDRILDSVRHALGFLPPHDYDTWLMVGMVLKQELRERGYYIWVGWSACSTKFKLQEMRQKWESFNA